MKVDTGLDVGDWAALPEAARRLEAAGCAELKRRYGDIVDRVTVPRAAALAPDEVRELLSGLR
jgi:hypothetical protein